MKNSFNILFFTLISILISCVKEQDVFIEDFVDETTIIDTSLIVSFLNEEYTNQNEEATSCSSFKYPLNISYNTNQVISLINEEGLLEVIQSQSSNFHINGLSFPFTVIIDNTELVIENTADFDTLFETCNITTLNTTLLNNINTCYNFEYPITLFDSLLSEINITSDNEFIEFIDNQGANYTTSFNFPIIINETIINNYFDIYQITNNCTINTCLEILYTIPSISEDSLTYNFIATGYSGDLKYNWSINNEFISNDSLNGDNEELLSYTFIENGTYNVCISIETPQCLLGVEYCQEIIINTIDECFDISFDTLIQNDNYRFEASGHSDDETANYSWTINGDFIDNELYDGINNEFFLYDFTENGTYTVCVFIETPECPMGIEYCEDVIINNIDDGIFNITVSNPLQDLSIDTCVDLTYNYINIDNNIFTLEVNNAEEIGGGFGWFINGDFIESGSTISYEFLNIGTYTICVSQETPDCPNGVSFCRDFEVE